MQAFRTSEEMNSRIVTAVEVSRGGAKSWRIERITRVIMLQQRVSCMRRTWVQNMITGSRMSGELRTKWRIDADGGAGSDDFDRSSGSVACIG